MGGPTATPDIGTEKGEGTHEDKSFNYDHSARGRGVQPLGRTSADEPNPPRASLRQSGAGVSVYQPRRGDAGRQERRTNRRGYLRHGKRADSVSRLEPQGRWQGRHGGGAADVVPVAGTRPTSRRKKQ